MANNTQSEQLDKIISALLGPPGAPVSRPDAARPADLSFAPVFEVIRDLRDLPRTSFKARLKSDLERRAKMATAAAKPVPEVRTAAVPYLAVKGAAKAIEFYKEAFGATEAPESRFTQPDGRVGHAEIDIGGARIMLADEFPEIGFRSPESLGGSPVLIHLDVPDVDAAASRAVAAGATVVRAVADQFYGDRSGHFRDPFGYTWVLSTRKEALSLEQMQERFAATANRAGQAAAEEASRVNFIREGFHTVTPYLVIRNAAQWIDFVKQAFDAEEHFRAKRPGVEEVIMHAEVKIGDSMIEVADANPEYPATPMTLLLRVSDPDAAYERAVEAGATRFDPVTDHDYGSRGGTVKDASGNRWHIFTPTPGSDLFQSFGSVTPHLYATQTVELIEFIEKAFGAKEIYRAQMPDGGIPHAQLRIGDSIVALAGGRGPYQPMPGTLHLYVPDTDAVYAQALAAGAASIQPPADQPYGDRSAGVTDPFGNRWFIATHVKDVAF